MNRPSPLCIEVLNGPDKGRVIQLDARTYRIGKDFKISGICESVDFTARQSAVDVDRPGESRVWLPQEILIQEGIQLRLLTRMDLGTPDSETGLPVFEAFARQLEELLQDVMGPKGYELFIFVLKLKNLKAMRDFHGLPASSEAMSGLAKRLLQIEGITHVGRCLDDEIVMVCARPVLSSECIQEQITAAAAAVIGLEFQIGSRVVSPHPHFVTSLLIESARPTQLVTPRTHRPVPEGH